MIKPATIKHLDEIENIAGMMFAKPWNYKQIMHEINLHRNSENLVYVKGDKVVAYMLGMKVTDEFHINNIAVHENFQR